MRHSSTFRRILLMTYGAVIVFALIVLLLYNLVSPRIFAANKIDDLIPKGQIIAGYIESTLSGEISSSYLMPLIGRSTSQWEATVGVVDSEGDTLIRTQMIDGRRVGSLPAKLSQSMLPRVLTGETATHVGSMDDLSPTNSVYTASGEDSGILGKLTQGVEQSESGEEEMNGGLVAVAVPIRFLGEVVGAVFMAQSMTEIMSGMRALTNTIMISLAAIVLLLFPVVFFFAGRLSRPLIQMRSVAMTMAGGDLSARADETYPDEYGELGRALNYLSSELGATISSLQLERNRLQSLINGLSEGIIALDAKRELTLFNPAVYTLLGIPQDNADIRADAPEIFAVLEEALTGDAPVRRTIWRGKIALRLSAAPLPGTDGGVSGCVGILSDVTSAERLEQTRRDYVANVSHELRTPLTALRALIEPLRDGLVSDENQKLQIYDTVLRETMRLSRLVNDMLELSRLQSGTASLQRSVFSLTPIMEDIRSTYTPYAEDSQRRFVFDVPDDLPLIDGNPDRTKQVLVVLLDNAFKYTPEGGLIRLRAEPGRDFVRVTVADNGVGIAEEDLPHVFERFYKADKSHHSHGTGLGLAIAYEIMKQLGEEMTVESAPGEGSRFSFTLHIAQNRI